MTGSTPALCQGFTLAHIGGRCNLRHSTKKHHGPQHNNGATHNLPPSYGRGIIYGGAGGARPITVALKGRWPCAPKAATQFHRRGGSTKARKGPPPGRDRCVPPPSTFPPSP